VAALAEARPGDLVYWNGKGGRPNHIRIYVGDGKMMHAPRSGDVVKYDSVRSAPPDAIRRVI
jgi:cell wall-associated NlpC family hydrolase